MNSTEKKIIDLIYEITEMDVNDSLNEQSSIIDDYHVDSLSLVTILLRLEDEFNILLDFETLNLSDIENVSTLAKLIEAASKNE